MILAAGRGERLRPLTDRTPKPLLEIAGTPLIVRHLCALAAAGIGRVVVNLSWLGEEIVDRLGDGREFGVRIVYSDEGAVALETAGGIAAALPLLGTEPFWLINGDVFTDFDFHDLALGTGDLAHVLLAANPPHNPDGDFAIANGRAVARDAAPVAPHTYTGIARIAPTLLAGVGRERRALGPLLFEAARHGRVRATVHDGVWDDIGTVERLEQRRRLESADAPGRQR